MEVSRYQREQPSFDPQTTPNQRHRPTQITPFFPLLPPHRHQQLIVQHHMEPVVPVVRVVHALLEYVTLDRAGVAGVLAAGDPYSVATAAYTSSWAGR